MKKNLKNIISIIIFVLVISAFNLVNAATGSFSVSPTSKTLAKGKSTTITITTKNCAGKLAISSSDKSVATVSASSTPFLDCESTTIKVTAKKAGIAVITITPVDLTDYDENTITKSKTVTIKVTDSSSSNNTTTDNSSTDSKKSTNANLSTLGVTPKEYDFSGFSSSKTSYSVTVPNDVDSLKVAYKTADSKATVKVTGNTNLEVGTNNIKVVVTAEDGKTTKTYTIKVTKLATEDNKPGNLIDDENNEDLCLTSLSIKNLEITPEFSSDVYSYETTIDMDNNDMAEVNVEAIANDEKATVEITGNTDLAEGENLINIIVKSSDSSDQKVYQITVNKVSQASEVVSSNGIKKEYLIIGGFILIVVIILAIIIINHIRNKKYYQEESEEENEENIYNNNLNIDEAESSNNIVEELFNKKNNGDKLNKEEQETIEDIEKENDRIFNKPKKGETVEYNEQEEENEKNEEIIGEDYIEERMKKRKKGKHF